MSLVIAFIAFNVIVIAHELGHFIVAKLSDIKVLEFSLFVGPKLLGVKRGETEYSLRLFPILAYVKMEGEEEESQSDRAYNKKSVGKRAATIAAGPFMNILLAVILFTVVFLMDGYATNEIGEVYEDSPAHISGLQQGDKLLRYDGLRVYNPLDFLQFLYITKGKPVEIEIGRNGEKLVKNFIPQIIPEHKRYAFGFSTKRQGPDSNLIMQVQEGEPAETGGLLKGDRIIGLDGKKISSRQDVDAFMKDHQGGAIAVKVDRSGKVEVLNITPREKLVHEDYYSGMNFLFKRGNLIESAGQSFVNSFAMVRMVGYNLASLVRGQVSLNQMMGPVGMVSTMTQVVEQSKTDFRELVLRLLNMVAFLSVALGATNLVPFPALDGSKLVILGVEKIRKKPIPPEREAFISMIGFVLIILLAAFTFYNDIARILAG